MHQDRMTRCKDGFTLIELSIVMVIIGLIIGGILTGQNLIDSAAQRAQIAQIEKYNTAVRTFQGKYGFLPGDIPNPQATQFGFITRGKYAGEGDGNGLIDGILNNLANNNFGIFQSGEALLFWEDLSKAGLIDGSFSTATATAIYESIPANQLNLYFPTAKIGQANYVYVGTDDASANYYSVAAVTSFTSSLQNILTCNMGMTVQQAYNIDNKIDDGLPGTGSVTAQYNSAIVSMSVGSFWAGTSNYSSISSTPLGTALTPSTPTTCMDNGGNTGVVMTYSTKTNANKQNCALSFKMQ